MAVFEVGEKLHIIERRDFETDLRRHFIGEIIKCSENVIRIVGYVWVFDTRRGEWMKKLDKRERILRISGGNRLTINVIPKEVDIEKVTYKTIQLGKDWEKGSSAETFPQKGLIVTDGKGFNLDINEFSVTR